MAFKYFNGFYVFILETDEFPNYNDLFKMINVEINKCGVQKPAMVSWLTPEDRRIALRKPTNPI